MTSDNTKSYKVEYLCTIDSDGDFCTSISSFTSLLKSYDKLKIESKKIFWDKKEFSFEISDGTVLNSKHKFFHLKFINNNIDNKKEFLALLKVIRTILSKVNNKQPPEILWDDISSEYAIQSYPIIHELENLMRKLITKFMLTKVGLSWTEENIPREVADSIRGTSSVKKQNYIYETDFIQLSKFLFTEYTTTKVEDFINRIKKANKIDDLDFEELKKIVPLSNWTRYFKPIVGCTSEELSSKWDKLYKIRCKVAHNNFMDEGDFNNLISNSSDVKNIIQEAIKNLDKVNITEEDKEELAENAAISLNKIYGDFVVKWKKLDNILALLNNGNENPHYNSQKTKDSAFRELVKNELLNIRDYETYLNLRHIRNKIVHDANFELDEFYLNQALKDLEIVTDKLINLTYFMNNSNGYYEISKKNESYSFVLRNAYGWMLLYGMPSLNKDEILKSIVELKEIAKDINNYEKIKGDGELYYFNLKGKNTLILATSEFYTSKDIVDSKIKETIIFSQTNQIIDRSDDGDETYALAC